VDSELKSIKPASQSISGSEQATRAAIECAGFTVGEADHCGDFHTFGRSERTEPMSSICLSIHYFTSTGRAPKVPSAIRTPRLTPLTSNVESRGA
jgi:hypothetical protein